METDSARGIAAQLDEVGARHGRGLFDSLLAQANDGDVSAIKALMDRIWPARNGRLVRFDMPKLDSALEVGPAMTAVIGLASEAVLTLAEAKLLVDLIQVRGSIFASAEFDERVRALEQFERRRKEQERLQREREAAERKEKLRQEGEELAARYAAQHRPRPS